jgi:hypothetical protein
MTTIPPEVEQAMARLQAMGVWRGDDVRLLIAHIRAQAKKIEDAPVAWAAFDRDARLFQIALDRVSLTFHGERVRILREQVSDLWSSLLDAEEAHSALRKCVCGHWQEVEYGEQCMRCEEIYGLVKCREENERLRAELATAHGDPSAAAQVDLAASERLLQAAADELRDTHAALAAARVPVLWTLHNSVPELIVEGGEKLVRDSARRYGNNWRPLTLRAYALVSTERIQPAPAGEASEEGK